jgi:hypothetical protein
MSQAQELIQEITKVGGSIQLKDSNRLRIEAPRGSLTNEQKDELSIYKQDIIQILKDKPAAHCLDCPYHDTGPGTFGKGVIHWCGPFKEPDGTRWLNIAELTACPKGKWGDITKTVH